MDYGFFNPYNPYPAQPNAFQFGGPINRYQQGPQTPAQAGMEVVPVQTIQQVEQVSLQPGQRKMVMVQNDAVVALRVADPVSGLVDTKYYNLVEFDPRAAVSASPAQNYVTPEQLEARLAAFADSLKPANAKKEAAE